MQYGELGKSGIKVSEVGLGAWQVGGPLKAHFESLGWISHGWGEVDDASSVEMIKTCGDLGINFIDTAAGYGAGHSEAVVGKAIHGQRDRWVVETKGGEGFAEDGENWKDFSYARLMTQVDDSLRRLDSDYVDVYLLHGPSNENITDGGCLRALEEIKAAGKARLVGVSLGPVQMGLDLIKKGMVDVYQVPLSLTSIGMSEELIPAAAEAGVGIVARGALGSGFYAGQVSDKTDFKNDDRRSWQSADSKRSSAATADAFRFLETQDRSLAQSCLKYVLSFEGVSTVIPGSKSLGHMRENVAASDAPDLTREELDHVAEVRAGL
jgi:aryl-alcohol dehydrogenase-like predicted oxidoreductase